MKTEKWTRIGEVGVDSGQLLLCDPCYIDSQWEKGSKTANFCYKICCDATLSKESAGQLFYKLGHAGVGVAFSSGYGDGCYPVFARYNAEGRIVEVRVKMA